MAAKKWIWKETAEVLGVLGVIGSLIFVAIKIRQNTAAVESSTIQGILDLSYAVNMVPVHEASLREAIYASPDDLSADQRRQLTWFYAGLMRVQINRFSQAQVGIFDESAVLALGGRGGVFQTPTFLSWWATQSGRYTPEFERYMDSIIGDPAVSMQWTDTPERSE